MSPCSQDSLRLSGRDPRAIFPGLYKGLPLWEGIFTLRYHFTTARGDVNAACVEKMLHKWISRIVQQQSKKAPLLGLEFSFRSLPQCSTLPSLILFVRLSSSLAVSKPLYTSQNARRGTHKVHFSVSFRQPPDGIDQCQLRCSTLAR